VKFVPVPDRTDCLRSLEDGTVDAILTHETFLLGFLLEDPNTEILPDPISEQHYGIAMPELHQDLVRWVNAELARLRDSGEIEALYDKHFRDCDICRPISPMLPDPFDLAARHG